MIHHTPDQIAAVARDGDAICLHCGETQEVLEGFKFHNLCESCGEYALLPARTIMEVLNLVEDC